MGYVTDNTLYINLRWMGYVNDNNTMLLPVYQNVMSMFAARELKQQHISAVGTNSLGVLDSI